MPPRRSRRTAGQDPDQLEMVGKDQGKPGGEECAGKIAAQGEEVKADAVENDEGSSVLDAEKTKLDVEEINETSLNNKEDFGKENSAENPDHAETICGEALQVNGCIGEKVVSKGERVDQSTCRLEDPAESGPSGERASHLKKTKKVLAAEEELYPGEEEVIIKTLF